MYSLTKAGSHFVRSTVFASALFAMSSAPSLAAPQFSQSAYTTATQDDVVYGEVPRQLIVVQKPTTTTSVVAPVTIGKIGANSLPSSIAIDYSSKPLSVGGIRSARSPPQFGQTLNAIFEASRHGVIMTFGFPASYS